MAKAKTHKADATASLGGKHETFGTVYKTMAMHPAYIGLSAGAKQFYTVCRIQATSKECRQVVYKLQEATGNGYPTNCFVFPSSHLAKFGYDRRNVTRLFDNLIKAGFIKRIANGQKTFKVNVYVFCNEWINKT